MADDSRQGATEKLRARRVFLGAAAAAVGAWWLWPQIAHHFVGEFDFEPLENPVGFRQLALGQTSSSPNPFIGIALPDEVEPVVAGEILQSDLCKALFDEPPPPGMVPIASFSDYNCPYCRVLTERLSNLEARSEGTVRITWHEWPVLGPSSVSAARAALAADMQGAYVAFHKRLMRTRFVPTPSFLEAIARDIGVDPDRLLIDMKSGAVTDRLKTTESIANLFGFIGTPALVVGRTVVFGAISDRKLRALLQREREDGTPPACVF